MFASGSITSLAEDVDEGMGMRVLVSIMHAVFGYGILIIWSPTISTQLVIRKL